MEIANMFNRIAKRYDFVNRVLSLGMDQGWRRFVVNRLAEESVQEVLDVAVGTGDLAIAVCEQVAGVRVIGLDPSEEMLAVAHEKLRVRGLGNRVMLVPGVAEAMPFGDGEFDAVTIGFGIRNAADMDQALREMYRVLKPGGRLFVLEFSMPRNVIIRFGYVFYLRYLLPHVGALLSGQGSAYRYLNKTIESFPSGEKFLEHVRRAGFSNGHQKTFLLGGVSLYSARR